MRTVLWREMSTGDIQVAGTSCLDWLQWSEEPEDERASKGRKVTKEGRIDPGEVFGDEGDEMEWATSGFFSHFLTGKGWFCWKMGNREAVLFHFNR